MTVSLLSARERAVLLRPRAAPDVMFNGGSDGRRAMAISVDFLPLVALVDEAAMNRAVYELMTISRPGDLLHYIRVTLHPADALLEDTLRRALSCAAPGRIEASVAAMDAAFRIIWPDDATPLEEAWHYCRQESYWSVLPRRLLGMVKGVQRRVRSRPDILLRKELALMDACQHPLDELPAIARPGSRLALKPAALPPAVSGAVLALVRKLQLPAVAACEPGIELWRELCALQMERADAMGLPPGQALHLIAADGCRPVTGVAWGGEVRMSWAGLDSATVTIAPGRPEFAKELAGEQGSLQQALPEWSDRDDPPTVRLWNGVECSRDRCLVMVTPHDLGELGCAWRLPVGGWVIYVEKVLCADEQLLQELAGREAPFPS